MLCNGWVNVSGYGDYGCNILDRGNWPRGAYCTYAAFAFIFHGVLMLHVCVSMYKPVERMMANELRNIRWLIDRLEKMEDDLKGSFVTEMSVAVDSEVEQIFVGEQSVRHTAKMTIEIEMPEIFKINKTSLED